MGNDQLLAIYLKDQHALGIGWRELAGRAARRSRGASLGAALQQVHSGISADVATFEQIMRSLEIEPSKTKTALARVGERAARFKLNGRLVQHSPLSRFEELDVLVMGLDGKVTLWTTLRDGARLGERLPWVDFGELIDRAHSQRAALEPFHRAAARDALARREPVLRTPPPRPRHVTPSHDWLDHLVDEASEQSFPASDAPSYWAGLSPASQEQEDRDDDDHEHHHRSAGQ
jgi:hypothetical protein